MIHLNHTELIHESFTRLVDDIINSIPDYRNSFNTKNLPDLFDYEKSKAPNVLPELRYFYEGLDQIKNHSLYYFELENVDKAQQLKSLLNNYRKPKAKRDQHYRVVPATNRYDNADSTILYLGVRRGGVSKTGLTNLVGRINQHLGYYKNGSTQGLQLFHFASGFDFKLTLNVYEFANLDSNYLNVIEKMMAQRLKPQCGRH